MLIGISKSVKSNLEENINLTNNALEELQIIFDITEQIIINAVQIAENRDLIYAIDMQALRELFETQKEKFELNHIQRLKKGECSIEAGIVFLDILNSCDRIIHHSVNTCMTMYNEINNANVVTQKEYYKKMYVNDNLNKVENKLQEYSLKYNINL